MYKEQKRIQINIRLPERMKEEIRQETDKTGISMNDYILLAVMESLRDQK